LAGILLSQQPLEGGAKACRAAARPAFTTFGLGSRWLDYCRRGLDYLWDEGATFPRMMSIGLHSRLVGQAARASSLKEFIEYALEKGDVWFARRIDIANWWNEHHEEFT
jgi:hypothetical protein